MESLSFGNWLKTSGAALSRLAAVSLALACVMFFSPPDRALAVPAGYHLAFDEDFSGSDITDTSFRYAWTGYSGTDNTADAVTIDGGNMTITAYTTGTGGGAEHWGGCVSTNDTYTYNYGYTEARVKFNNSQGCTMSYWLESDPMFWNPPGTAAEGIEIDIIEHRHTSSDNSPIPDMMHVQLHAGGYEQGVHYQYGPGTQPTVANLEDNWHVLGCEWDADGYTFYCDGAVMWSYNPTWLDDILHGEFRTRGPEWLIFSAGPSGDWSGDQLATYGSLETSTTKMTVDYCRVYQKKPLSWNLGAGGSGTWNTGSSNWNYTDGGAAMVYDDHEEVYFRGNGGTVTISGFTPSVQGLHFESDGYTITGGSLELRRRDVCVSPDMTATINSTITGDKGLVLRGLGTLVLGGNNNYTGETRVKVGTVLNIQHANALGSTADGTVVGKYAALQIQGGITTANEPLLLGGSGISYNGALRSMSGNNTYAGLITLASGVRIRTDADSLTLSNAGTITGDGHVLMILGAGNTTINSVIGTGDGGLTKASSGTLTLTRANTYTGPTVVENGTLVYGTNNVIASGSVTLGEPNWASGTLNMGNYSDTVGAVNIIRGHITGNGTLTSTSGFTVQSGTVNVQLAGSVGLTKTGAGTVTLSKHNAYTGTTAITDGTLAYGISNAISNGPVTISSGTLSMGSYYDSVGAVTISCGGNITGTATLTSTSGFTATGGTVSGRLGGSVGLTKNTSGSRLTLSGNNTYSGTTTINGGSIRIQDALALGSTAGGTIVNSGGTLELFGGITTANEALTLNGTGYYDSGAMRNISGNNTYGGLVTLGSNGVKIRSDSGTLTLSNGGTITGNGYSLTFDGAGNTTVHSVIAIGAGTVTKDGLGTVRLTGNNIYTGQTNVLGGTLELVGMVAHNPILSYGGCDIELGKLVLDNPYSVNSVESLIEASYDGGDWDSGQFLCSTADADHGLGWINDSGDIVVAYTVYGDVNLDGYVNDTDVDIVEGNLNTSGDWADGDVNYDGYVNYTDLAIVNDNYGMTQSFMLEIDPVPEPSTLILLAVAGIVGAAAYVRRRRAQK